MIDPITAVSFSVYENKGTYALLLGSGISRTANIPTGWEITLDLVRRIGFLQKVKEQADWSAWYRQKYKKEPSYSDLLASLASTPDQRRAILHSYIEPTDEDLKEGRKVATKAHKAIARLVRDGFIRVIVTTNFDRLLENSLREVGVEPTVIKSVDDIEGAVPLTHARCYVVKVHGDYLDTRIKNTEEELRAYSKKLNQILDRIFDEFGLIVCGWSSEWDEALRSAVSRAPNRRYSTYWTARGELSSAAKDLVASRAARVIEIDGADEFFSVLQSNIETQATLQGQDPRSIELLISSAKRFLARPEDRIHLEELIGREVRLLNAQLDGDDFSANSTLSDDRIQTIVSKYEAVTEPAARLFGILGRFGEGQEYKAVVHAIRNLASPEPGSGLTLLLALRSYPARLLLFSYGMGLIKAERYVDLFNLFSTAIGRDHREDTTVVESLIRWEGDDNNFWNRLAEFPEHKRKTPLSDHLHTVFEGWSGDYLVFPKKELTPLFEGFELLGALAHIGQEYDEEALSRVVAGESSDRSYVWAPMGRAIWDGQTCRKVFDEWRRADVKAALIAAGFARSSGTYLDTAIKSLDNLAGRHRW